MKDLTKDRHPHSLIRGWGRASTPRGTVWTLWVPDGSRGWTIFVALTPEEVRNRDYVALVLRATRRTIRVHQSAERSYVRLINSVYSQNFTDRT